MFSESAEKFRKTCSGEPAPDNLAGEVRAAIADATQELRDMAVTSLQHYGLLISALARCVWIYDCTRWPFHCWIHATSPCHLSEIGFPKRADGVSYHMRLSEYKHSCVPV